MIDNIKKYLMSKAVKISTSLPMVGIFSVYKVYPSGEKELAFKNKNLITNGSKQYILSSLYLPGVVSDPIIGLKAGTGGALDPQGLYPKPEDPTATDLNNTVISIPTVYTLGVSGDISVTFLADIDQSQGNGMLFTEAGLLKASGPIFNIKNHPGIPKTSDFSLHYEWTVRFL